LALLEGRDLFEDDAGDELAQRPGIAVAAGARRQRDRPVAEQRLLTAQDFGVDGEDGSSVNDASAAIKPPVSWNVLTSFHTASGRATGRCWTRNQRGVPIIRVL
jgi:hypothetical protein